MNATIPQKINTPTAPLTYQFSPSPLAKCPAPRPNSAHMQIAAAKETKRTNLSYQRSTLASSLDDRRNRLHVSVPAIGLDRCRQGRQLAAPLPNNRLFLAMTGRATLELVASHRENTRMPTKGC